MNDAEHGLVIADRALRLKHYGPMVRRYYECVTATYRHFWGDCYHFAIYNGGDSHEQAMMATEKRIAAEGAFRKGIRILEVGCGLGGPALNIAEWCEAEITAIDLCEHHVRIALERARARGLEGRVRFTVADGMKLPFADRQFDRVYVFEAGCHTPDKEAFCRECARVLQPGGEFLGLDWMQHDGLTERDHDRYIEPICRYCSLPDMISPTMMGVYLNCAGFEVIVSEAASSIESLLPNWKLSSGAWKPPGDGWDADALARISQGGQALEEATRAGAFVIGHWRSIKR